MAMPGDARIKFIFSGSPWGVERIFSTIPRSLFFGILTKKKRVILFDTNQALAFLVTK